ncbi:hypothetical protein WDW89_15230 [Deltaproteobacteria bacterium TL4]
MRRFLLITTLFSLLLMGCTEESRNRFFRSADNLLGKDFLISYISEGKVVKTWKVLDGKITTGKDENGAILGYYYFWAEDVGYVQIPIVGTLVEEIRK